MTQSTLADWLAVWRSFKNFVSRVAWGVLLICAIMLTSWAVVMGCLTAWRAIAE